MGLLSNIGKAFKNVVKGVSLNNVVKVVTGNGAAVVKDLTNRALTGLNGQSTTPVNNPALVSTPVTGRTGFMGAINAATQAARDARAITSPKPMANAKTVNIGDILQGAAGGALAGAGVIVGGDSAANAAVNTTGWTAVKTWLKNNWISVSATVVGVGGTIWAIIHFSGKKGGKRIVKRL